MKKLLFLFIIPFIFAACSSSNVNPVIPTAFEREAEVLYNDVSFKCSIKRDDISNLTVSITSPEYMKGTVFSSEGEEIFVSTGDISYQVSPSEVDAASFIMTMTGVLNSMTRVEDLTVKKVGEKYEYTGKCKQGSFLIKQNSDYSYESISLEKIMSVNFI